MADLDKKVKQSIALLQQLKDSYDDYIYKTTGFWQLDCKQWLSDFFKVDL